MEETQEVFLEWRGWGKDVLVAGEFSNWVGLSMVKQTDELWSIKLKLKYGEYMHKFIVDGEWKTSDGVQTIKDKAGNINNLLVVERTLQPWPNGLKDTCDNVSENISDLLEGIIDDIYLPSAPTIELTPPSLESEVDKVTDYLNEINEAKEETSEVTLKWAGPGKEVFVAGSFSNWEGLTMTNEEKDLWKLNLKLKNGQHLLNYIVDGKVVLSDYMDRALGPNNTVFNILNIPSENESIDENIDTNQIAANAESTENDSRENSDDALDDEEVTDVTITWEGVAKEVLVSGDFSNWIGLTMTNMGGNTWSLESKMKHGNYHLMFFVDGEVLLSDSLEQVTGDDDEVYNLLSVESEKASTYKKYSTYDNVTDCVTKPINDDATITKTDSLDLETSDNIMHGKQFSDSVTIAEHSNKKKMDEECDADACEPFIGATGLLEVRPDKKNSEVIDTNLIWKGKAEDVKVAGEFSNWIGLTMSRVDGDLWKSCLKLKPGTYDIKFMIAEVIHPIEYKEEAQDAKTLGSKPEAEYIHENMENNWEQETCEKTIVWKGRAKDVKVLGEFSDWNGLTMSKQDEDIWSLTLKLKTGTYLSKFIVDGKYMLSEQLQKVIGPDQETYNLLAFDYEENFEDETDSETDSLIITEDEILKERNVFNPFDDNFTDNLKEAGYNAFVADINEELSIIYEEECSLKIENEDMKSISFDIPRDSIDEGDNGNNGTIREDINAQDVFQMSGNINLTANDILNASDTMKEATNEKQIDINNDGQDAELEMKDNLLSPYKSSQLKPTVDDEVVESSISWKGFANEVKVIGAFSNWEGLTLSNQREDIWKINLKLKCGQHLFKYIVDGKFTLSKYVDKVIGPDEEIYNVIEVFPDEFENGYIGMVDVEENFSNKIMNHNQKISLNPFNESFTDSLKDSGYEHSFEDQKQELSSDEEQLQESIGFTEIPEEPLDMDGKHDTIISREISQPVKMVPNILTSNQKDNLYVWMDQEVEKGGKTPLHNNDKNLFIGEAIKVSGSILTSTEAVFERKDKMIDASNSKFEENIKEIDTIPMLREDEQMNVFLGCSSDHDEKVFTIEEIRNILDESDQNSEVADASIDWFGHANDVRVLGEFSNWEPLTMSKEKDGKWSLKIKQKTGQFLLKFIVDGKYTLSNHMESVIGSDQELYNLLDVLPNSKEKNTIEETSPILADINVKTKLEKKEEEGKQVSEAVPTIFAGIPRMVEDAQTKDKVLELDAVETLEKTLVNTNYVIHSNTEKETLKKDKDVAAYEELTIPLIRNTDDQLNVFLAMDMQQSLITVEPKKAEELMPIVRSLDDQLSVFLAADIHVNTMEEENEVSNMSEPNTSRKGLFKLEENIMARPTNPEDVLNILNEDSDSYDFIHSFVSHTTTNLDPNYVEVTISDAINSITDDPAVIEKSFGEDVFKVLENQRVSKDQMVSENNEDIRNNEKLLKEKIIEEDIIEAVDIFSESIEKERLEQDIIQKDRLERERLKEERMEKERLEQERIEEDRFEQERIKKEQLEQERLEKERMEQEIHGKERLEMEKIEQERIEKERIEQERIEKSRLEQERIEKEKLEQERIEKERLEKEKIEKERLKQERLENERLEQERTEKERIEKERLEMERLKQERIEKERLEQEKIEKNRLEQERIEKERFEKERLEKERIEQEKLEKERLEQERIQKERLEKEKIEKERLEKERLEKERLEMERLEKERLEQEKIEKESIEKERLEQERIETNRLEEERIEKERLEMERLEKERLEQEKLKKERLEQERIQKERLEKEIIEKERLEQERLEKERLEQEKIERERLERERFEQEKNEKERLEQERIEKERLEQEKIEKERLKWERLEKERLEQERIEKERLEMERLEQEKMEKERLEQERIEKDRLEKERLEKERLEKEKLEQERIEKEKLEKERIEKERLEKEKIEKEQLEKKRLEEEKIEKERLEKERIEMEKLEQEKIEKERLEQERLEKERLEQERIEKERIEKERLEMERLEQEKIEKERLEQERIEKDRLEKERLEKDRLEKEKLEQEIIEKEKLEKERIEKERLKKEKIEKEELEKKRLEAEKIEKERLEKERIEKERLEQEKIEKERLEQERIEKEKLEQERIENERVEKERIKKLKHEKEEADRQKLEKERIEKEVLENERLEKDKLEKQKEKERKDQERLAEQKKRIELEIEAEELRIENEKRSKVEQDPGQSLKKIEETDTNKSMDADEKAIVEDIRIQMLIDKNNKLLLDEQEREEKEKARIAREAEERAQVEEQIRREEEKLEKLRLEKEIEEQNKKKEQDMKKINDFIEQNNKSKLEAEKQMTAEQEAEKVEQEMNGKINAAFVENEKDNTVKIATPTNLNGKMNHESKAEQKNGEICNGKEDENATKVAIEQAKNAAEATVANIEEILMKKEDSKEVSNGTFVSLEVESSDTSLDCRKKNPVMRKLVKLCQCNIL